MMETPSRLSQFTFDIGKSAIKLFLRVIHIKGKLLLSVNTGYRLRNFARMATECSLKFNVYSWLIAEAGLFRTAEKTMMLLYRSTMT